MKEQVALEKTFLDYSFVLHVYQFYLDRGVSIDPLMMNLGLIQKRKVQGVDSRIFEMFLSDICTFFDSKSSVFEIGYSMPPWKLGIKGVEICNQKDLYSTFKAIHTYFSRFANLQLSMDMDEKEFVLSLKNIDLMDQAFSLSFYTGLILRILKEVFFEKILFEQIVTSKNFKRENFSVEFKSRSINKDVIVFKVSKNKLTMENKYFDGSLQNEVENIFVDFQRSDISDYQKVVRSSEYLLRCNQLSLETLSEHIGFSKRKIQFVLAENNLTFMQVKDDLRKDLCRKLVLETDLDLDTIYAKAGFASLSSFCTAFKKWFGTSPKKFMDQNRGFRIV